VIVKALIMSNPNKERLLEDKRRFTDMITQLKKGGVEAKHAFIRLYDQLVGVLDQEKPDIVFPAAYYVQKPDGEKINIAYKLDEMHKPYIGSDSATLELVLSKSALKARWKQKQVLTPEFCTVHREENFSEKVSSLLESTPFPYIIKPDKEGNSRGLDESSIVFNRESLRLKGEKLLRSYDQILIEKYLGEASDIREYTIALIGHNKHMLIMPTRIMLKVKHKNRIITTRDKDTHNTIAKPVLDLSLRAQLTDFARKAFKVSRVRDYARLDVMLTGGLLYAIEINGQPMVPDKWFEACAKGAGLSKSQYLNAIFFAGIQRCKEEGYPHLQVPDEMIKLLPEAARKVLGG
jgi:D-alanine-D-alanine ligase-like ATP-grasp enzyme